jgi:hypothetical protein
MTSSPSSGGSDPLNQLMEGIDKLKHFAAGETDTTKKANLDSKINELERRAANYMRVMRMRGQGDANG